MDWPGGEVATVDSAGTADSGLLAALLGDACPIDNAPRPPIEALERTAREHWSELCLLPPAFRETVLVAQLRAAATEDRMA